MTIDLRYLKLAIRLGDRQLGRTGTRPAVGCVLVKNGRIVGTGATGDDGAPHAEVAALAKAGDAANGADAYVSLEPCAHFGKTPPCADALSNAGIKRAVVAFTDPDPRVQGLGFERMRLAGIEVHQIDNIDIPDALDAFFITQRLARPMVTAKIATTLDGKAALANGESKWITASDTRRHTRALRGRYGAIAVGVGTILTDDPNLNTRQHGQDREPRIVIYDRRLRTPVDAKVFANQRPIIFCAMGATNPQLAELADIIAVPDIQASLGHILNHGISTMLVEGGPTLVAAFAQSRSIDRILHAQAPALIGADGLGAIGALGFTSMEDVLRLKPKSSHRVGDDWVHEYRL